MRVISIGTLIIGILFASLGFAQAPEITKGLSYLSSTQNPDGSWGNGTSKTEILPSTVAVIETLVTLNQTDRSCQDNGYGYIR